jgi:outer membrane protein assembly factor BamE
MRIHRNGDSDGDILKIHTRMTILSSKRYLFCLLPLAAGCSSVPQVTSFLTPYRIDVRQGNFVSQEMVAQLKPGQTKDQVRFILGTPLVADMFHADRWDYVYRFQPGHGEPQERRLVVFFSEGKLLRVGGDVVAEDGGGNAQAAPTARMIEIAADPEAKKAAAPDDGKDAAATSVGN